MRFFLLLMTTFTLLISCQKTDTKALPSSQFRHLQSYQKNGKNYYIAYKIQWIFQYNIDDFNSDNTKMSQKYNAFNQLFNPTLSTPQDYSNYLKELKARAEIENSILDIIDDLVQRDFEEHDYILLSFHKINLRRMFILDKDLAKQFQDIIVEALPRFKADSAHLGLKIDFDITHSQPYFLNYLDNIESDYHRYVLTKKEFFRLQPVLAYDRLNVPMNTMLTTQKIKITELIFNLVSYNEPSFINSNRQKLEAMVRLSLNDWIRQTYPKNTNFYIYDLLLTNSINFSVTPTPR